MGQSSTGPSMRSPELQNKRGRRRREQDAAAEETLGRHFRDVVRDMDDYLNPLLTQFDFSCFRPQASSPPVPEMTKAKEEKGSSAKFPAEPGECVVLLADRKLLQLPLEALTVLQGGGLSSLSRDFSLQLLHSRLNRAEPDKG
ncbi:cilia- and flagella-associated protein 46-like isoform X2 [Pseudoliparis swirei]|nr:cilia- and flagella-associated protein 46-like isoform X2 [Pseudoliparis swirei]